MDLRFIEEPSDVQFAHTRSAILNCTVDDRPANITWKIARGDHVINSNITGVRYLLPNGSLYFPAFTEDRFNLSVHRADYQCIAKTPNNKFGNFEIISKVAKLRAGKLEGWGAVRGKHVFGTLFKLFCRRSQIRYENVYRLHSNQEKLPCLSMKCTSFRWRVHDADHVDVFLLDKCHLINCSLSF